MGQKLLEKKKFSLEELRAKISQRGTVYLQDLIETEIGSHLFTMFVNHTLVVRDVQDFSLIGYDDKSFIHGIVDVYDRVLREKLYNSSEGNGTKRIENDHLADIVIQSNLVINVIELNVSNYIQCAPGESVALKNKYLVELYTDWHTQRHYKEDEFFKLFF